MVLSYARRPSYSLCVTRPDWVPTQLYDCHKHYDRPCEPYAFPDKGGGPYCPVKFVKEL